MSGKKRIALYGGTFDPVHFGHVELARTVSQIFEIDELLFVPAWLAPHKRMHQITPAIHRYAMLVLATQHDDRLKVSRFELEAPNRKYTVETIEHFQARLGNDVELFFVMGADSWAEIKTWRDWERLLKMTNHIVVTRPGYEIERGGMSPAITRRIVDTRDSGLASARETPGDGTRIFISDAIALGISATEIRKAAREGQFDRLANLVPEAVASYIMKYELYRETNES